VVAAVLGGVPAVVEVLKIMDPINQTRQPQIVEWVQYLSKHFKEIYETT
jgi:hypothetical protein